MKEETMMRVAVLLSVLAATTAMSAAHAAESVMVQCGKEYQAARTAGTLNGMDWTRFRTDCATRLKAEPASTVAAATSPSATPAAPAPAPTAAPATAATPAVSGGMAAMHVRQKQCGAEWRAQKATLVVQTPGLTWPHYWSLCNARLKAAK